MRFKLDENVSIEALTVHSSAGHDVETALSEDLGGAEDALIWARCQTESRAIVTLDLDFSDIRTYPPAASAGIVVLRLVKQDKETIAAVLQRHTGLFDRETVTGQLWIIEEERVRIRGAEPDA